MSDTIINKTSVSASMLTPDIAKESLQHLLALYCGFVTQYTKINTQKRQLLHEAAVIEMQKLKIERHLITLLEASDCSVLKSGNSTVVLSKGEPQLLIYNPKALPKEYTDKRRLKRMLLKGFTIPGVKLAEEKTIGITTNNPAGVSY